MPECADARAAGRGAGQLGRPRRRARAHHRQFAVRGPGHRGAPDRSGRERPARGRAGIRPCGAQRPRSAGPRHRRLRARRGGDQPPRPRRAGGGDAPRSLVLFSPFERRAFGQTSLQGFDGWLVKPVRVGSLFERLARQSPAPCARGRAARRSARRPASPGSPRRGQRHQRADRAKGPAPARLRCGRGRPTAMRRCASPR